MFWRRPSRDELDEIAYRTSRSMLSESTRISIERMVDEMIKADLQYIRGELLDRAHEAYARICAEMYGPDKLPRKRS